MLKRLAEGYVFRAPLYRTNDKSTSAVYTFVNLELQAPSLSLVIVQLRSPHKIAGGWDDRGYGLSSYWEC